MNNNISIVIGAIIISLAIFFTFNKEEKVVQITQQSSKDKSEEYKLLQEKLERLQNKLANLSGNNQEVLALKEQIESLEYEASMKDIMEAGNDVVLRDGPMIYNFLDYTKAKPLHDSIQLTQNGTPYIIYAHPEEDKEDEEEDKDKKDSYRGGGVIPPRAPNLSSLNVGGEKVYYNSTADVKKVSVLSVDDGKEILDSPTEPVHEEISPPDVPPTLFEVGAPSK